MIQKSTAPATIETDRGGTKMTERHSEDPISESIWQSVEELDEKDLDALRKVLNEKARQRRFQKMHEAIERASQGEFLSARQMGASVAAVTNLAAEQFNFDGDDSVIGSGMRGAFNSVLAYTGAVLEGAGYHSRDLDDPSAVLEHSYQDAQNQVIQMRQATAQAIATEKQLEHTLSKNKEQGETWRLRAEMAIAQKNEALAHQAQQREAQFVQAVEALEEQLHRQKEATTILRQKLTLVEIELQKMSVSRSMLTARYKALKATRRAHKIFSQTDSKQSPWQATKKKIADAEEILAKEILQEGMENADGAPQERLTDSHELLVTLVSALDRLNALLDKLEEKNSK
jgi:phage shock protein A